MAEHNLKTHPYFYSLVLTGVKKYEVRVNDKDYRQGDFLVLSEFHPVKKLLTGRRMLVKVTHVLHGGQYGIHIGWCILSIEVVKQVF